MVEAKLTILGNQCLELLPTISKICTFPKVIIRIDFHSIVAQNIQQFIAESADVAFDLIEIVFCHSLIVHMHLAMHEVTIHQLMHHCRVTLLLLVHLLYLFLKNRRFLSK